LYPQERWELWRKGYRGGVKALSAALFNAHQRMGTRGRQRQARRIAYGRKVDNRRRM